MLLKFLGEQGMQLSGRIKGAAAVSVPYDLEKSSRYIDEGFSKVYQWNFLRSLRRKAGAKLESFPDLASRESLSVATTMTAIPVIAITSATMRETVRSSRPSSAEMSATHAGYV